MAEMTSKKKKVIAGGVTVVVLVGAYLYFRNKSGGSSSSSGGVDTSNLTSYLPVPGPAGPAGAAGKNAPTDRKGDLAYQYIRALQSKKKPTSARAAGTIQHQPMSTPKNKGGKSHIATPINKRQLNTAGPTAPKAGATATHRSGKVVTR